MSCTAQALVLSYFSAGILVCLWVTTWESWDHAEDRHPFWKVFLLLSIAFVFWPMIIAVYFLTPPNER